MSPIDLRLVDELCFQIRQYSDTIEKLMVRNKCLSAQTAFNIAEVVVETRKQMTELISAKNATCLDQNRITTILNLIMRYEHLEGALKEMRNDLQQGKIPANQVET